MKIALVGYGKMGKAIEQIALSRGHEIAAIIDMNNQYDFDSPAFKAADVAIEFTTPEVAIGNYRRCFQAKVPVVAGTTGWLEFLPEIRKACEERGQTFFYASNFSIGVNIFFALNRYLAKLMNNFPQYDARMKEVHHIQKLDAPSGTAITLAEGTMDNLQRKMAWTIDPNHTEDELFIEVGREGMVPGYHAVTYESEVDRITIEHDAKSRHGFALGAVLAAEFVYGKKGFLTMEDMMPF